MKQDSNATLMTFGGHLDVLRKMLFRIGSLIMVLGCVVFFFKEEVFHILLAPHRSDFVTFRVITQLLNSVGFNFQFIDYDIPLINTELAAQLMTHLTVACILGALLASPYILYELFHFVSPALYENEKRLSILTTGIIYLLFALGLLMSYFILFPFSFRFLATYQVDNEIANTITLDSYISTFTTLTFMMGIVFQLPMIAYILGKLGLISMEKMVRYRPYALVIIMVIAAIITPPDLFTLVIVTIPIYALYELSILILKGMSKKRKKLQSLQS